MDGLKPNQTAVVIAVIHSLWMKYRPFWHMTFLQSVAWTIVSLWAPWFVHSDPWPSAFRTLRNRVGSFDVGDRSNCCRHNHWFQWLISKWWRFRNYEFHYCWTFNDDFLQYCGRLLENPENQQRKWDRSLPRGSSEARWLRNCRALNFLGITYAA